MSKPATERKARQARTVTAGEFDAWAIAKWGNFLYSEDGLGIVLTTDEVEARNLATSSYAQVVRVRVIVLAKP